MTDFEVIIIGGGHGGVEAATASARRGAATLLLSKSAQDLGAMSCNPSMGGPGKSQLISEIDALGGIMSVAADMSGIHWRMLNIAHGSATRALRAQIDRNIYKESVKKLLAEYKNLTIIFESVEDLDLKQKIVNKKYSAKSIVLTTGTFLGGLVHRGSEKIESGRMQDDGTYQDPDTNISNILKDAGFSIMRLKTGTPARIYKDSINFDLCEPQPGSVPHEWFSFESGTKDFLPQTSCFITHTTESVHEFIRKNIKDAPMYNGDITGTGPRYCPSLEDKVMRFPEHTTHHVFLEPEGLHGNLIYPNGISTSFSKEIQDRWIRMIPGLANARIARFGYAIEYDAVDARALKSTLESKDIPGLFFAGQINGTSGYEEAAAQGIIAGSNAAAFAKNIPPLDLDRTNSMIGVLIDDITTLGVDEPYRMFTSRAEFRLSLRSDNAISRLGDLAEELGLITKSQHEKKLKQKIKEITENDKFYAGYIARNLQEIESYKRDAMLKIPSDFKYDGLSGLTNELIEKLSRTRPENIADLSRIPGITPAGIMVILRKIRSASQSDS